MINNLNLKQNKLLTVSLKDQIVQYIPQKKESGGLFGIE